MLLVALGLAAGSACGLSGADQARPGPAAPTEAAGAVPPVTGRAGPGELEVCAARSTSAPVTLWADGPSARSAEASAGTDTACGRWVVAPGEYQVGVTGLAPGCLLRTTLHRDGRRIFVASQMVNLDAQALAVNVSDTAPTQVLFERRCAS
ncbi:MAG: hypothetical protein ACT4QF_08550 [Sporichthyaceae bacterium]